MFYWQLFYFILKVIYIFQPSTCSHVVIQPWTPPAINRSQMDLTKSFLEISQSTSCKEIESNKAMWGEATVSVNKNTPMMIQETAFVILKQFHHLLWFTSSYICPCCLETSKKPKDNMVLGGPEALSACNDTDIIQTRNQHKRKRCGIELLAGFMPMLAQSKNGVPHVPFLSGSIKGELWAMELTLVMEPFSRPELRDTVSTFHQHASYCLANGAWKESTIFQYFSHYCK